MNVGHIDWIRCGSGSFVVRRLLNGRLNARGIIEGETWV